ncbi:hypothetical protein EON77_14665, partial [bacterium]
MSSPAVASGGSLHPPPGEVAKPAGGIDFEGVIAQLESSSLSFPAELVASYLLALQTRRFVLLTGISGTGKTQLALEVARLFSPRATASSAPSGTTKVVSPYMIKQGRIVVPAELAREFDFLETEERRVDVRLFGGAVASMAVPRDRPGYMMVLLKGEEKRRFQEGIVEGETLLLQRETKGDTELLSIDRATADAVPTEPTYELVAVRPDWTDSRALLGFYNPLTRGYATTPTLDLVIRAREEVARAVAEARAPRPFFLLFDEMNLARVEHYFSDFLSAMESGEALALHDDPSIEDEVPRRLELPHNLFVVGTVNVDETTYLFSPKVLDRAFVLEFNDVNLDLLSGKAPSEDPSSTPLALTRWTDGLSLFGKATDQEWATFEALEAGKYRTLLGAVHA